MITLSQFQQMIPTNKEAAEWYDITVDFFEKYNITTPLRIAGFMAQCAHESQDFRALEENLNYSAESLLRVFPRYFGAGKEDAAAYARNPEKIANKVYASRMGNGDERSGDGWKYRGRGLIQLTGKDNYTWFAASIEESPDETVKFLETYEGAVQSACWFWESNNLNALADKMDVKMLTKRINGGFIGLEDRIKHINHAVHVLSGH